MRVTRAQVADLQRLADAGGTLPLFGAGLDAKAAHELEHLHLVELESRPGGLLPVAHLTDLGRRAIEAVSA